MQTLPPTNRSIKLVLIDPTSKERFDRIRAGLPALIEVVAVADASDEELERHISDADVLLVGRRSIDDRLLDLAPNVRFIQKSNAGYDMIDIEALKRRGVIMANNAGGNSTPVAEYTVMMMLALLKRLVPSVEATRSGRWPRGEFSGSGDLEGSHVGIIGFGAIGQAVAARLQGFGAIQRYYARHRVPVEVEERLHVTHASSLQELLTGSSIVTVHASLNAQNARFLGDAEFAMMPEGALFINAARGGLVDEGALVRALQSGHLGGAAVDVYDKEEPGHNPLYDLPNVLVTPHSGASSRLAPARSLGIVLQNIAAFAEGRPLVGIISELRSGD